MNWFGLGVLVVVLARRDGVRAVAPEHRRPAAARWRAWHGRSRSARGRRRRDADTDVDARFPASELDITLGERATLVQFSTAFCQPCRATRRVLGEVAELVEGVVAVEVDAEAHLDVVRQLNVMRTPTVFVLDGRGVIVRRASGQPRKADVIAAIGALDLPASEV